MERRRSLPTSLRGRRHSVTCWVPNLISVALLLSCFFVSRITATPKNAFARGTQIDNNEKPIRSEAKDTSDLGSRDLLRESSQLDILSLFITTQGLDEIQDLSENASAAARAWTGGTHPLTTADKRKAMIQSDQNSIFSFLAKPLPCSFVTKIKELYFVGTASAAATQWGGQLSGFEYYGLGDSEQVSTGIFSWVLILAYPVDAYGEPAPAGYPCGNPGGTPCDDSDVCQGGRPVCLQRWKPNGTKCLTENGCQYSSTCNNGVCAALYKPINTPCGNRVDSTCDRPDTCDGKGNCRSNLIAARYPCTNSLAGKCQQASCDGKGGCLLENKALGTSCGTTECATSTCNGNGQCTSVSLPYGAPCGAGERFCSLSYCDGAGNCRTDYTAASTPCGPNSDPCVLSTCNGNGTCNSVSQCSFPKICTAVANQFACDPIFTSMSSAITPPINKLVSLVDSRCQAGSLATSVTFTCSGSVSASNLSVEIVARDEATFTPDMKAWSVTSSSDAAIACRSGGNLITCSFVGVALSEGVDVNLVIQQSVGFCCVSSLFGMEALVSVYDISFKYNGRTVQVDSPVITIDGTLGCRPY